MRVTTWRFRRPYVFNGWHVYPDTLCAAFRAWLEIEWCEMLAALAGRKPINVDSLFRSRD